MNGFEYKYKSPSEIINEIKFLLDYSTIEYIILFTSIIFFMILLLYIAPSISIGIEYWKKEKEKNEKKKIIKQMILQKNLEEEIEKELDI